MAVPARLTKVKQGLRLKCVGCPLAPLWARRDAVPAPGGCLGAASPPRLRPPSGRGGISPQSSPASGYDAAPLPAHDTKGRLRCSSRWLDGPPSLLAGPGSATHAAASTTLDVAGHARELLSGVQVTGGGELLEQVTVDALA